jgi:hypothetical protein
MSGQGIAMSGSEEIKQATFRDMPAWHIKSSQKSPMMTIESELYLDRSNLHPVHAKIKQGPVLVEIDYGDNEISGKINMQGNDIPIQKELDGPVLGSSQLEAVMHTLPLEKGFKTNYRTFDLRSQNTQLYSLEVTGTEKVTVPAGEFETYRVETISLDGGGGDGVYYVSMDGGWLVKAELNLPAASGGGTAVLEAESME